MAFQFPAGPTLGQVYNALPGLQYVWNGTGWSPTSSLSEVDILHPDGTASAPGISWISEPDSGFYRVAARDFIYRVGGVNAFGATATMFNTGPGITVNFNGPLNVTGALTAQALLTANGSILMPNTGSIFGKNSTGVDWSMLHAGGDNRLHVGYQGWTETVLYAGGVGKVSVKSGATEVNGAFNASGHITAGANVYASNDMVIANPRSYHVNNTSGAPVPVIGANASNNVAVGNAYWEEISFNCAGGEKGKFNSFGTLHVFGNAGDYGSSNVHSFNCHIDGYAHCLSVRNGGGNGNGFQVYLQSASANQTNEYYTATCGSGKNFAVWSNSGIWNNQAANISNCDANVKQDIRPAPDYTDFVERLQYKRFSYISDPSYETDDVIAQELETLDSTLVSDKTPDGTLGVYSHRLQQRINSVVPRLIERIKEVESLANNLIERMDALDYLSARVKLLERRI